MDIDRNFKAESEVIREINERQIGYWRRTVTLYAEN